jgi:hypothetical protein
MTIQSAEPIAVVDLNPISVTYTPHSPTHGGNGARRRRIDRLSDPAGSLEVVTLMSIITIQISYSRHPAIYRPWPPGKRVIELRKSHVGHHVIIVAIKRLSVIEDRIDTSLESRLKHAH